MAPKGGKSSDEKPEEIANRILLGLPQATLERLRPSLEFLVTERGRVIDRVDAPIEHLYFVNRGLVSVIKTMEDGRTVEIGAVGIEGVTDPNALFGFDTALLETIVQVPGSAYRIRRETLMHEVANGDGLRDLLQKYAQFTFTQIAQTAACNRLHSLEERCCRWLLIANDNALADTFPLTHEFLSMMLGVQRAGVSIAMGLLQRAGYVEYQRGSVTILNRAGLQEAACECYHVMHDELEKLFKPHP